MGLSLYFAGASSRKNHPRLAVNTSCTSACIDIKRQSSRELHPLSTSPPLSRSPTAPVWEEEAPVLGITLNAKSCFCHVCKEAVLDPVMGSDGHSCCASCLQDLERLVRSQPAPRNARSSQPAATGPESARVGTSREVMAVRRHSNGTAKEGPGPVAKTSIGPQPHRPLLPARHQQPWWQRPPLVTTLCLGALGLGLLSSGHPPFWLLSVALSRMHGGVMGSST